jgi:hypothetical protein
LSRHSGRWLLHLLSPLILLVLLLLILRLHGLTVLVDLLLLRLLTLLTSSLLHLLVHAADAAGEVLAAVREGLGSIDIDRDVALDVLDADDLVIDRAERGEDEIEMP